MSWKDRIDNSLFSVTTGDGSIFFPLWKGASRIVEYNVSEFNFIDVEGTYVDRRKPKGNQMELTMYFQGENNIEDCEEFDKSASDPRFWTVNHPIYGVIYGQPLSIEYNDDDLNCTVVKVEFHETIQNQFPLKKDSLPDLIAINRDKLLNVCEITYPLKVNLETPDLSIAKETVTKISLKYDKLLDDVNYNEYKKLTAKAFSSVDNILYSPASFIYDVKKLIEAPAEFNKSITQRFKFLGEIYKDIKDVFKSVYNKNQKAFFESTGASVVAAMVAVAASPITGDYLLRRDVQDAQKKINDIYDDYLNELDLAHVVIENSANYFEPSYQIQEGLKTLVNISSDLIYQYIESAKQERFFEAEKDTNVILLTHKYLGLDKEDKNIEIFRKINNIKNKSLFVVKKGTKLKYYK